jgi:hypothetical protein
MINMNTPLQIPFRSVDMEDISAIAKKIQGLLCGRVRNFRLMKEARGLILKGHAPTYHAKQLAQHAVMETTTVPILANEIEVRPVRAELVFT